MVDQSACDPHDLDNLNLIAIRRLPGVFPDQRVARAEIGVRPVPTDKINRPAARSRLEETGDFRFAAQHPVALVVEEGRHQRAFEDGVFCVKRKEGGNVARTGSPVPFRVDVGVIFVHGSRLVTSVDHDLAWWTATDVSVNSEICVPNRRSLP
jgi:hypothetical protein